MTGEGIDYESFTTILGFNATTSQICIGIATVFDGVYELPELFSVGLTSQDTAVNNISSPQIFVTIMDNDEGQSIFGYILLLLYQI